MHISYVSSLSLFLTLAFLLLHIHTYSIPLLSSCKPRLSSYAISRMRHGGPAGAMSSGQTTLILFIIAFAITASRITYDPQSYRIQLLGIVAFVDCFFLMLGHSWDSNPVMETIYNCRLFYVCIIASINIVIYIYWSPMLSTRYTSSS